MPRVFISSTSEFAAEREQLKQQIEALPDYRLSAYIYEADAAGGDAPEERLRRVLENSEIVLLILGDTFGSEYPGRATSIVEWEYEYAKERQKELKAYVKHPPGPNTDPRQAAFISRAVAFRSGSWVRKFASASQMIGTAIADLKTWVGNAATLWLTTQHERTRWKDRLVLATTAGTALVTVVGVMAGALMGVPRETLLIVGACGLSMFAGLFVLLKSKVF